MAKKKSPQKKYCNRLMIPEEDQKDWLIPKTGAALFTLPLKNIKFVHPYCLTISKSYAKYMPESMQLALTPEQIVYIPDMSMIEFTDKFFEKNLKIAKENRDKIYEYDIVYLYDDGSQEIVTEQTTLLDKLWKVQAMALTQKKAYEQKRKARSKKDEQKWIATDQIPERKLADILDISVLTIKKVFADVVIDPTKRNCTYSYSKVLEMLAEKTVLPANAEEVVVKEYESFLELTENGVKYKSLPLLYQQKVVYEGLGLIFKKIDQGLPTLIRNICQEKGFLIIFDELGQKGYRFIASDLEVLSEDPNIKEKIIYTYDEYGLKFDKEKHKLPY